MTWTETLFAFSGRINRARYWIGSLITTVLGTLCVMVAISLTGGIDAGGDPTSALFFGGIVFLIFGYSCIVLNIKRCHDRDMSGWWVVIFFVAPSIIQYAGQAFGSQSIALGASVVSGLISLWALVELGFFRGTDGPNRFGRDPLAY